MPKCIIVSHAVPDPYMPGAFRAVSVCQTHSFPVNLTVEGMLCPMGRIEAAADEAIERISRTAPQGT